MTLFYQNFSKLKQYQFETVLLKGTYFNFYAWFFKIKRDDQKVGLYWQYCCLIWFYWHFQEARTVLLQEPTLVCPYSRIIDRAEKILAKIARQYQSIELNPLMSHAWVNLQRNFVLAFYENTNWQSLSNRPVIFMQPLKNCWSRPIDHRWNIKI